MHLCGQVFHFGHLVLREERMLFVRSTELVLCYKQGGQDETDASIQRLCRSPPNCVIRE